MPALTKLLIDAAQPRGVEYFIWCGKLPHFGARIYPTGKKVFIAQVRVGRMIRRVKIGPYGVYTVDAARKRAEEIIRAAAEGRDPQREKRAVREAITVAELCDKYLEAARAGLVTTRFKRPKRPSTSAIDEGRVLRHIKPLIGAIPARDLKRADVQRMTDDIAAGKTAGAFEGKPRGLAIVSGGAARPRGLSSCSAVSTGGPRSATWSRARARLRVSIPPGAPRATGLLTATNCGRWGGRSSRPSRRRPQ